MTLKQLDVLESFMRSSWQDEWDRTSVFDALAELRRLKERFEPTCAECHEQRRVFCVFSLGLCCGCS